MNPCKDFGHHNSNILLENVLFFNAVLVPMNQYHRHRGAMGHLHPQAKTAYHYILFTKVSY